MSTPDPQSTPLDDLPTQSPDGPVVLAGRYRVVRRLGEGGMGVVYLAEDQHLDGRRVAIKMPSALLSRNARAVADLKREAVLAMTLSHPHIVTLRAFEQTDDSVFLVMDYIDGTTLDDLLAEKQTLDEATVRRLFRPLAGALDYAHGRRLLHRDIKPGNILLDREGRPYLTDFGIARELKSIYTTVTGRQEMSGTLPYMSPQQVNGDKPEPSHDVYALAAAMYECLKGHPPFHRGDITDQIRNKQPEPLPSTSPLARQVMRGLSKQAADRPARCIDLLADRTRLKPALLNGLLATVAVVLVLVTVWVGAARWRSTPSAGETKAVESSAQRADEPAVVRRGERAPSLSAPAEAGHTMGIAFGGFVVYIPAGEFVMGSTQPLQYLRDRYSGSSHRYSGEYPPRRVRITKPFRMGTTPVTVRQFRKFIEDTKYQTTAEREGTSYRPIGNNWSLAPGLNWQNPDIKQTDDHPVVHVTHDDALAYCRWLSTKSGSKIDLPTEAQWEYACRAGTTTAFWWGDELEGGQGQANEAAYKWLKTSSLGQLGGAKWDNGHAHTSPVATFKASAWNLYDMAGNVWEWCADWYGSYPSGDATDPAGPIEGTERVLRGGSWFDAASLSRSSSRSKQQPMFRSSHVGFRVVVNFPEMHQADPSSESSDDSTALLDSRPYRQVSLPSKIGKAITNSIGMTLTYIPAGVFTRGSPAGESFPRNDESQHVVIISKPFLLGVTEVTQQQWYAVMKSYPSVYSGLSLPVERVSWTEAVEFCRILSEREGRKYRLPTEAEWEYACRAGTRGPYAGDLNQIGWYLGNSTRKTRPIKLKLPNAWGLYDMHGNVAEWCSDVYGPYPTTEVTDPVGPGDGPARVLRGGAWNSEPHDCRSASRLGIPPSSQKNHIGFRVVLDVLED